MVLNIKRANVNYILFWAVGIKFALITIAFVLPVNILELLGAKSDDQIGLISYAPEVWISLLALVFGTLIIVVSIASENTPKLVDLFIGDPRGRLYIWLIVLSALENIFLQLFAQTETNFISNLVILNNYMLLPIFVLLAIPYAFYTLKSTKNATVIARVYKENVRALMDPKNRSSKRIVKIHATLFETINQLYEVLQYVQFAEPRADIIQYMGKSLRIYLKVKYSFASPFFRLSELVKRDISFRTLANHFEQIESNKTFYEHKVLKVLDRAYLLLIDSDHYELASLCGSELCEVGRSAVNSNDDAAMKVVILHFNTMLRYGINHGIKKREIRSVYNTIFHYSRLVNLFVEKRDSERILECCKYFDFYRSEVTRLSASEPQFVFLINAFFWELKKLLVILHTINFKRETQKAILLMFSKTHGIENGSAKDYVTNYNTVILIQIALGLFYFGHNDDELCDVISNTIIKEYSNTTELMTRELITRDCLLLNEQSEEFWEETDQGNGNMFYSPDKDQIGNFIEYLLSKTGMAQVKKSVS